MPGTIQVSVLDFKGLSSPAPPSSLFIKVSMGKREYQTWDKGDFSFPLTTLRDSLIVTLQDAEENEISRIGVQSMLIVEKGIWDDLFPLEGGGHVHMKLQFILNEDERNRIRGVRESALKKKQGEVPNYNIRHSKETSGVGDSVASSPINHEVSAKQVGPLSNPDTSSKDSQSNNGKEGTIQKQITPNATDRCEESAPEIISSGVEVHHMSLVEKTDTQLPHADVPASPIFPQDDSSMSGGSRPVFGVKNKTVCFNVEDNPVNKQEKHGPLRKPPSSVRKMISAFETSLVQVFFVKALGVLRVLFKLDTCFSLFFHYIRYKYMESKQERRPPIIQMAEKSQSNRTGKEGPLKDQDSRHITKEALSNSGRLRNPTELSSGSLENPAVSSSGRLENPVESSSRRLENPAESSLVRLKDSVESSTGGPKNPAKLNPGWLKNPADSSSGRLINPAQLSCERLRNPFLSEKSQKILPDSMITGEHISIDKEFGGIKLSPATRQLMESSTSQVLPEKAGASIKSVMMSDHKEMKKEQEKSPESFIKSFSEPGKHKIPFMKRGEHVGFNEDFGDSKPSQVTKTRQVIKLNASKVQSGEADASNKSELKSDHKEMSIERYNSSEGLMRSFTSKTATVLGQKEETSHGLQPSHFDAEQKDSGGPSVIEGGGEGTRTNNSSENPVASNNKLNSDEQYHCESSSVWIFPDDTRHLCITTGISEVMKLDDGCHAEGNKSFSVAAKLEKQEVQCGLDAEMMKSENNSQKFRKSKPERSADDDFTGPIKQVIKIAIIIGFGALVLFTRQREPRKSSRKANDPFFTKLHYIDLQTSMEE